jgi:hypothetical protein
VLESHYDFSLVIGLGPREYRSVVHEAALSLVQVGYDSWEELIECFAGDAELRIGLLSFF